MADTSIGRLREDICHYLEDDLASGQRFSKKIKKAYPISEKPLIICYIWSINGSNKKIPGWRQGCLCRSRACGMDGAEDINGNSRCADEAQIHFDDESGEMPLCRANKNFTISILCNWISGLRCRKDVLRRDHVKTTSPLAGGCSRALEVHPPPRPLGSDFSWVASIQLSSVWRVKDRPVIPAHEKSWGRRVSEAQVWSGRRGNDRPGHVHQIWWLRTCTV